MRALLSGIACITLMSAGTRRAAGWDSIVNGLGAKFGLSRMKVRRRRRSEGVSFIMVFRLLMLSGVCLLANAQTPAAESAKAQAATVKSVLSAFGKFDLVALGEWHNNVQDHELRVQVIRHPDFARRAGIVVVECANWLHQATLDRFVAGEAVSRSELKQVWRDTTQSPVGGGDMPICEQVLSEVRSINRRLPKRRHIRVLAGDPPINWSEIRSADDFAPFLRGRDEFAAKLVVREVLAKSRKALLVWGAGHIWRGNTLNPAPNLAALIDREHPGKLFTVIRLGGVHSESARLEALIGREQRPIFVPLATSQVGKLSANAFVGRDIPVKLFPEDLGLAGVADGLVYSGQAPDRTFPANPPDSDYEAEKQRRRGFMPRPPVARPK